MVTSTVSTATTTTSVAISTATAPAACITGGLYEANGAVLELSCLTDFSGYSASSLVTADMSAGMQAYADANSATIGFCVGVSYDYATSICSIKYGIDVKGTHANTTAHSARILPAGVGPCRDESTLWGDIFIPSGSSDNYTMFCAYNHPDGDQKFYCGAGASDLD